VVELSENGANERRQAEKSQKNVAVVAMGRRGGLLRCLLSSTGGGTADEKDGCRGLNGIDGRRAKPLDAADWSYMAMSTGSWLSPTEGSTTSENEIVESVGVAPPKNCARGASCESSPGEIVATTATRDNSAGAGTDWRPRPGIDGVEDFALGGDVDLVTLVRALTIGAKPLMPSPASA
jgi:hypothetical protein